MFDCSQLLWVMEQASRDAQVKVFNICRRGTVDSARETRYDGL